MPTNVTKPDWQCDICRRRYGPDLATAERCEAAPPATPLPAGTLLLSYDDSPSWNTDRRGFHLSRLYPLPLEHFHGTLTSPYRDDNGHFAYYLVGVDPSGHINDQGVLNLPRDAVNDDGEQMYGRTPTRVQGDWLIPHRPGVVQVRREAQIGTRSGSGWHNRDGLSWITGGILGMDVDGAAADAEIGESWVRPLTPDITAVFAALNIRVAAASPCNLQGWKWHLGTPLGAVAGEQFRTGDGHVVKEAAKLWLRTRHAEDIARTVDQRWSGWLDGKPGDVPMPQLRAPRSGRDGRQVTYSKLPREVKKLVAATGVVWPERTNAAEYAQLLIKTKLGYTVTTTDHLFPNVANIVAVGGGKGGVGKSVVAAALARRLADQGRKVTLIDCDVTGPSQHLLFDLGDMRTDVTAGTVLPTPTHVPRLTVVSPGQLFPPGATVNWTPQTIRDWITFVGTCVDLTGVDTVILDLPPGENTVHEIVFGRGVALTAAVHVTTASPLALADTGRSLETIGRGQHGHRLRAEADRHFVVENLPHAFGTDSAGNPVRVQLQGQPGTVRTFADDYGIRFGGSLPWVESPAEMAAAVGPLTNMLPLAT